MSLRDVEEATDISNGYVSQMESGRVKQPSPHHLHALAQLYGREYAELMALAGYHVPVRRAITGQAVQGTGLAFAGAEDLTSDEREYVERMIETFRRARGLERR
jgi:transcriptional regulator with XRE-family HTH domain